LHAHNIHIKFNCFDFIAKKKEIAIGGQCGARKRFDVFMSVISDTPS
jgi:hypothetical protein